MSEWKKGLKNVSARVPSRRSFNNQKKNLKNECSAHFQHEKLVNGIKKSFILSGRLLHGDHEAAPTAVLGQRLRLGREKKTRKQKIEPATSKRPERDDQSNEGGVVRVARGLSRRPVMLRPTRRTLWRLGTLHQTGPNPRWVHFSFEKEKNTHTIQTPLPVR